MSNQAELLQLAEDLKKGLFLVGPNRVMAMSTHATRDLLRELEEKASKLVEHLESK